MIIANNPRKLYELWLDRIVQTHVQKSWDQPPTDESDDNEEWFEQCWDDLSEQERKRLWGLSADLHSLRGKEQLVQGTPLTAVEMADAQYTAWQQKQWDQLLELLRRKDRIPPPGGVAYLRGRAWQEMGEPGIALLFFDLASRLEPNNATTRAYSLDCLKDLKDLKNLLERCELYTQTPSTPARTLFRAAEGFFFCADQMRESALYLAAIDAIDKAFFQLQQGDTELPSVVSAAIVTKAFCLDRLGRLPEAVQMLNEAVSAFPDNTRLVVARGLLKLQLGVADGLADLRQAVDRGTEVGWAYVEVAKDDIRNGRNSDALATCKQGLLKTKRPEAEAQLLDLRAIAAFRLQRNHQEILADFRRAAEIDPLREHLRANSNRFDRYLQHQPASEPDWDLGPNGSLSVLAN